MLKSENNKSVKEKRKVQRYIRISFLVNRISHLISWLIGYLVR